MILVGCYIIGSSGVSGWNGWLIGSASGSRIISCFMPCQVLGRLQASAMVLRFHHAVSSSAFRCLSRFAFVAWRCSDSSAHSDSESVESNVINSSIAIAWASLLKFTSCSNGSCSTSLSDIFLSNLYISRRFSLTISLDLQTEVMMSVAVVTLDFNWVLRHMLPQFICCSYM